MAQLGLLTPSEMFDAIGTGKLPTIEDSLENQKLYKAQREDGLYEPLIGAKDTGEEGRPAGSKAPQSTKNVKPIGTSAALASYGFGEKKLLDAVAFIQDVEIEIVKSLKTKHKITELNDAQKDVAHSLAVSLVSNEKKTKWKSKVQDYIENHKDLSAEASAEIEQIQEDHKVSYSMAVLLRLAKVPAPNE